MTIPVTVQGVATAIALVISSGIVPFAWRRASQIDKNTTAIDMLQRSYEEKRKDLNQVKAGQEGLETRMALVERAIEEFAKVAPELQKIGQFAARMEEYVVGTNRRLELLEDRNTK